MKKNSVKINLINTINKNRKDWQREDFTEAYQDEWEVVPATIKECREKMTEHLYHTYDISLLEEIVHGN